MREQRDQQMRHQHMSRTIRRAEDFFPMKPSLKTQDNLRLLVLKDDVMTSCRKPGPGVPAFPVRALSLFLLVTHVHLESEPARTRESARDVFVRFVFTSNRVQQVVTSGKALNIFYRASFIRSKFTCKGQKPHRLIILDQVAQPHTRPPHPLVHAAMTKHGAAAHELTTQKGNRASQSLSFRKACFSSLGFAFIVA